MGLHTQARPNGGGDRPPNPYIHSSPPKNRQDIDNIVSMFHAFSIETTILGGYHQHTLDTRCPSLPPEWPNQAPERGDASRRRKGKEGR